VALPKERREAMLKAAGNIVDLGLTEPIDLAARLDKLAPNGSLRKYARSFWRLMTGFNADLQESPDWQAVFDSIDAPSEQVKPSQALVQTVPQKLPPPTAKDLFDREKYPGRQYAAPPNTVTFQLRGLNTYPIAFPLQAVPASSLEEASKIIKDRFIDLIEEFDGSMRESSFAYIGPDGVATHLGEFMYDRPMQWRPYSLSEDPFNKITAESNVTPPQAAAIAKEEAMPEPAKQAAPFDPVAAKGQKKYLLTEVAAAVKAAPRRSEMPEDVRDALNEIDEITAKFANQERRPLTADESAELSSQVKKLSAKVREAVGTITIEVPGDGTFTILNEKGALALFQKRADKFPTTQSKDDMPAKPTAQSPTAVPAIKKPKTTADVVAAIYPMVSTDTTRDNLTTVKGDGTNLWATNGRILVRVEQENGGGKGADNVSYDEKGNAQPWPVEKGNYNGEAIIPEDRKVPVHTIDTGRWFSIMSQARAVIKVLPSDKSESTYTKAVSIYRNPDGSLGVFVSDVERGDYVHNIQPNAKFLASYDPEYVQTILRVARNLGNEQIELRIADDISPATLHTSNATFVIMPMRMNGAAAYSPKATAARPTPPVTTQPTPAPTPAPSTAPAKAAPASAPTSPAKEGIDDFGEKLGGARKDKVATVNQTLTDDEIAGKTLSEIWPKSEIASIEDDELAAYATTLRSVIPSKPQQGYKLNAWVGKVKMVKQLMRFAEDKGVPEMLAMMRGPEYNLGVLADRVAFLQGLPREHWDRVGEVRNYPNAYRFGEGADSSKKIPAPYADANVDGYRVRADNLDDLMEAVKAKLAKGKPVAKIEFEVRGRTGAWGINKKGDPHYRKLKTFADSKEALAYRDSNYDDLVKAWEDVKERDNVKETDLRTDTNRPRSAEDWRKGKDATSQMFNDAFGFRGVEFGNWVSQGKNAAERQGMMNDAYDALHDLASILNIPTKALSLNGQIGLGFGSRGQGWASAHYEPGSLVINLTKTRGAGTLAHELFHAFDHYFGRARGVSIKDRAGVYITNEPATRYVNQKTGQSLSVKRWNEIKKGFSSSINEADWKLQEGVRPEVEDAFEAVVKALDASPMAQRARMNDKGQRDYWGSTIERAARAFENYVIHKMQQKGYQNDYLANVVRIEDFVRNPNRYPYLLDNEIEPVAKAFDDLFSTIKSRETDKGVELYAPPSQASVGQAVNEAFVKKVQDSVKAGRTVGTSNPTTASKTGEGTDSGHNVELDRLRKNNPLAYRQNALILTRYPVVAKKYRALHAAMAKADAPVIAAKEEVKKAKAALAAAQKGIKDRVALLRGMKTAQVRASLVNEFIAANLTARAVKAKDVAHANLAKANAKAAKAADYQSKAISEILDGNAIPEDMAAQIYEDYITAVESNLLALIELFPKRLRDVARLWYDGANIIAQKFGEQYNATIEQASAVLAVFSPQKDWFMNVSLAQRMMNIWKNDQETAWSPEMTKQFIMRSGEPQPVESIKKGDTEPTISTRESLITDANPEGIVYQHGAIKKVDDDGNTYWENWDNKKAAENLKAAQLMLKDLEGKTLSQIKDRKLKARFIRILSEVRDSSAYPIVTPDGRTGAMQVNNDKVTLSKVAWGGYNTIEKAISIMERSVTIKGRVITDEHEVISIALGDQHKVRSFYNNIVDPANKSGHVTMDTHAIAAIHWMPHSGSSLEVTQNFGGGGVKNDGIAGIKGTYAANAEAYRRAAVVFDLLPREVQSITWEAVRLLFPKEFKTKGNIDKVRAIWNRYFHGDIDIETARAEIFALATTSKDFPQGKDIAGSIKDGKGLGDTAWAAAMGVGFDHPGGPEGTDDSGTVPQRGGPRGPNPRGGSGQSGGNGGGRNPAAVVRPTSILRRGGVGKPSLSLPPGQASPEAAAWKTVDGRTWLTEAEAKSTGLMYYNIEPDEAGLNDQVTEEERRMLQRGKVLDIEAESVPPSQAILRAPLNDSEADTLNRFDADAEESPAKVASSTSVHALRSHPDFNSAKFHGGVRQALNLVENFLKPAAIKEVRQAVGGDTDKLVFVPVLSREGDSMNMIPLALANELNRKIGGKVWTKLVKVSSAHNTDASNIDRAHTVHNWSGELPPEGSTIVLVDDTFTTGQTLQSLGDMFQKVAAVTTLAAGRYGKNFRPTKDQVAAAMKKANLSHSEYLKYRPTGAAIQSYLLNGKPGRNGWDERFTGEGSGGGSTTDGGDAKIPSLLSFFSGGGLLEVGLRGLVRGFGAVEFDANIAEVYAQNHGEHIDAADIRTINFNKFKGAEYFHASPVCKQFSGVNTHASKGENDADVTTAEATAKALKIIRPAVFTLENVKAYEGSSSLKIITDTLDDLGYTWDQGVYDAADYGAPTHRKRFLIRAVAKGGLPPAPKPTHGPKAGKPYKSWWSAVEDLVDELPSSPVPLKAKDGEGDSYIVKRMALMGVDLLSTKEPVFLAGGSASANNLPFSYSNEPAPVIKATNAEVNRILLPDGRQLRATPRVLARVTGLPDSYKLPESQELAVKVIGNGIPPALTRAVFGPLTALASRENPRLSLGGDDPVASAKAEAIKFLADKNPAFLRELESDTDAFPHGAYMLEVPLDQLRPGNAAFDEKTIASIPDMSAPIMVDASALFSTDKKSAGLVVSDGNHRLEKAKRRGDATIRAIVTPWDDAGMELVRSLAESERVDSTSQAILRAPPNAGVPTQITRDMRQQLLDRGYTKKQIHKMKPAEAHAILNPPVEPASPEPEEAGQTDADMEAFIAEQQAIAEEEAAAREALRNDPDAIDAVQASGKMSGRNLSKQFEYPEARAVYQALTSARDQLGGPETVQLDKLREWAKKTFDSDPEKYVQWAADMAEESKLLDVDEQAVLGQAFQFLTREARLTGDKNIRTLLNKVGNYYLDTGTRLAQAMSARRDPLETPQERWTKAIDIVFGPSEAVRRNLRILPTDAGKARRIASLEAELAEARGSRRADVEAALKTARAQETKEELLEKDDAESEKIKQAVLKNIGVTEDDLMLAGTDRVALHSAILDLPAVKEGLDAYKGKDNDGYNIMRLAFRGFSDEHIANALNLNQDDVGQFINDATNAIIRPAVAEQVKAGTDFGGLIKAGFAKLKKAVGLSNPPKAISAQSALIKGTRQTVGQVTAEVNRVMAYALQSAKARNSGKLMSKVVMTPGGQRVRVFVPFDPDDMANYYAFAREFTAAKSSAFDKVYEYWINWPLLSGPQTQVANITGNAAQVAWHYTGQRLAEATLNLAYQDPNSAQFREFKHVLKGFWQGIGPAFDMARQTFLTEGDTIRHKYLGEPMEIDVVNGDLDKVGNIRASVGGKLGRINRLPGRVLRFTDAFFKTAIMYAEASAVAYRRAHVAAKAQGLTGKARSTFIDTEIANTINDTSSAVWGEVMKTAEELLFQDENMATEIVDTVLGGYKGIRDLEQKLAEAEAKGDYEQSAKLQKRIRSRKIVGSLMRWIFPFQRTPTNIVRVGIKKAGGSAISLLYGLTMAGWRSMGKNGVPMIKSYPKAMQIKDASETLLAGLGWLALASMLEGDDDDDKKKVLLVGTRSHSLKDRGATDQFLRKYGGENSIVWQDGNGKVLGTLPFGRYEPAATLLTTWIDAYRNYQEVKRLKSQGENALYTTYMMSSLVSSLEDKSFLQGFANAMQFVRDVEEKRESPDENAGSKMLMNNIIPNLIKQPLRNMDDVLRERTTAGSGYAALPNPAVAPKLPIFAAQPKISTTGERLTKAFTPPARLLFQANTKVTPQADALLYRANRLNPTKRWSPQPLNRDDYTADPPGKAKPLPITDPAKRRQFAELAGRLYAAKAAQVAAKAMPSEKSKPTPSIITAFKKAREDAMAAARAQAHAIGLHKPTSTP
jgi:site-specific DNA-cytosine methylase/hypoxanthine-guanine phosphoribosyltransferase